MPAAQSAEFDAAVVASKKLVNKPSDDDLLDLYALFKQATQNPPFEEAPKPGTFDFKGKAKYAAWKKVADEGISAEEAQKRYVDFIEKMKEKYGFDESKQPEQVGGN